MNLLYYILLCFIHILALPLLCVLSLKEKYKRSIPFRFLIPKNRSKEYYDIWLHACSVGEVQSLQTLIDSIPQTQHIFLSVITQTGYKQAQALYAKYENLSIDYLPFETFIPLFAPTCKKLFVFEAELWLMLFIHAKRKGATTKLINARISSRSAKRYQKLKWFYKHFFSFVDSVLSQSNEDTERLKLLGANNVKTIGNLKLLNPIKPKISYKKPQSLIIVAASTHANEEEFVLNAWKKVKIAWQNNTESHMHTSNDDLKNNKCNTHIYNVCKDLCLQQNESIHKDSKKSLLIVVPRHPERFYSVLQLCKRYGKTICLSELQNNSLLNLDAICADILLVDTIGSLIDFYAISDIVMLGGAFAKVGGHNPLEPATFHNVLISGTEIFNQKALFTYIQNYYLVDSSDSLEQLLYHYKQLMTASINKDLCSNMIKSILE